MNRIVVLESDAAFGGDLAESLHRAGWQVHLESTLPSTLVRIEKEPPRAALIEASGVAGLDRLRRIIELEPHLPVVAMGAQVTPGWAARVRQQGAVSFLRKPFGVTALEEALAAAIQAPVGVPETGVEGEPTRSPAVKRLLDALRSAAMTEATIQLVGEVGTGKSELARRVHEWSARRTGPFTELSCASMAVEAQAAGSRPPWSLGGGGTVVLDEIAELSAELQGALLRTLERSGSGCADRVIVTTRRDLDEEVRAGRLREDLLYRLDVITLQVPPLRDRPDDIPSLAHAFLQRFAAANGTPPPRLSASAARALSEQPFPGNIRELQNWMRRAVVLFPAVDVDVDRLLGRVRNTTASVAAFEIETVNLRELERCAVVRSLAEHGGNRTRASAALGISVRTLRNKIRDYGLA